MQTREFVSSVCIPPLCEKLRKELREFVISKTFVKSRPCRDFESVLPPHPAPCRQSPSDTGEDAISGEN
jgi:hypothetical protein